MLRFLSVLLLLLPTVIAAAPEGAPELTLNLSTKNGRRLFRIGEPIVVELAFSSSRPKAYELHEDAIRTRIWYGSPTRFGAAPASGTSDPLGDYPYEGLGYAFGSAAPRIWALRARPVTIENYLNDWVVFRKAGRYRITAENRSVTYRGQRAFDERNTIPVRSNTIEIEVREPEPGWATAQLQLIVAVIEGRARSYMVSTEPLETGKPATPAHFQDALRFLHTEGAALQLLRYTHPGWHAPWRGLFASPHRQMIIQSMEGLLASPDFPVSEDFLEHLLWLKAGASVGPRRASTPLKPEPDYFGRLLYARTEPKARYVGELTRSLNQRRGNALGWATRTLQFFR